MKYGGTTGLAAFSVVMYVDSIIGMLVFEIKRQKHRENFFFNYSDAEIEV